jgi:hypothetical protein
VESIRVPILNLQQGEVGGKCVDSQYNSTRVSFNFFQQPASEDQRQNSADERQRASPTVFARRMFSMSMMIDTR